MSSSSEEDNLDLLREALDVKFVAKDLYNNDKKKDDNKKHGNKNPKIEQETIDKPPSLRRDITKEDDAFNFFRVTPEFQEYVSKQLSKTLEKQLKELLEENVNPVASPKKAKKKRKNRVRLLKTSANYITDFDEACDVKNSVIRKYEVRTFKSRIPDDFISEEERCKLSAVNPEDVIGKKEVEFWSKRSKAQVFEYKKDSNGDLSYQQPQFV